MSPSFDQLRVRLIQIRERPEVLAEERESFLKRTRLAPEQLAVTNALRDDLSTSVLGDVDAVLIGGAGAYSVTKTYTWTDSLIDLCTACGDRQMPLFGSCWGHQFIARAFGGSVIHDDERSEMGTHQVELTEAGKSDPLFEPFPPRFLAQMGHQDRVAELPSGAIELATNDVAPYQAFRLADAAIYGTQFPSELDDEAERGRLIPYRDHYPEMQVESVFQETLASLRPTPDVDGLLYHFLQLYAVEEADQAA